MIRYAFSFLRKPGQQREERPAWAPSSTLPRATVIFIPSRGMADAPVRIAQQWLSYRSKSRSIEFAESSSNGVAPGRALGLRAQCSSRRLCTRRRAHCPMGAIELGIGPLWGTLGVGRGRKDSSMVCHRWHGWTLKDKRNVAGHESRLHAKTRSLLPCQGPGIALSKGPPWSDLGCRCQAGSTCFVDLPRRKRLGSWLGGRGSSKES